MGGIQEEGGIGAPKKGKRKGNIKAHKSSSSPLSQQAGGGAHHDRERRKLMGKYTKCHNSNEQPPLKRERGEVIMNKEKVERDNKLLVFNHLKTKK